MMFLIILIVFDDDFVIRNYAFIDAFGSLSLNEAIFRVFITFATGYILFMPHVLVLFTVMMFCFL